MKRIIWMFGFVATVVAALALAQGTMPSLAASPADKPASSATIKIRDRAAILFMDLCGLCSFLCVLAVRSDQNLVVSDAAAQVMTCAGRIPR